MAADLPPPTLRLTIDAAALAANWRTLDRMSGTARAGAAVKADAYGLGVDRVVPVLRDAGARDFFVAHWREVPAVLRHVPAAQVAVLHGPMTAAEAEYGRATGVRPVLNSMDQIDRWQAAGGGPCHVMIDSGINRLGLPIGALGDGQLADLPVEVLMSHLASADEDSPQNEEQRRRFEAARQAIGAQGYSLANSAGIALGRAYHHDLTRPGLALYGGIPRAAFAGAIRQVAYPQAAVLQLRDLAPGDGVGYNATFVAPRAMRVAAVTLGYADGYLRVWSGRGALRCGDAVLPVLGRVSMDLVMVDATTAPHLREGDWLDLPWNLPDAATASGLSQYELLTGMGARFRA